MTASKCSHIYSCSGKFYRRNPVMIRSFAWGERSSPLHWPTESFLFWKWLQFLLCFMDCYTIDTIDNCLLTISAHTIDFHYVEKSCNECEWWLRLSVNILPNLLFCIPQKKLRYRFIDIIYIWNMRMMTTFILGWTVDCF